MTSVLRADFHVCLRYFERFEVWHFYNELSPDITPEELGSRAVRFKNVFDLILKVIRVKPRLVQGGEPYDFPLQFPLIIATVFVSRVLRIRYYFPSFENLALEEKFSEIKRLGVCVSGFVVRFVKWVARVYAKGAVLIFAGNRGAEANLKRLGVEEERISRVMYGTWGVDTDLFTSVRDGTEPDMGECGILFVGRLVREKGILVLISAFEEVKRQNPVAELFIVGDGELKGDILRQAESLNISSAIHLLGVIPNQKLPGYFRAARVTVTPSIRSRRWVEQVGMVNIQSMACGTPVISTKSGAIPEFVIDGKTGILVLENDAHALAQAIIRLLTDEQLYQQVSKNARDYALEHYDARRNVQKVEEILWQCLNRYADNI